MWIDQDGVVHSVYVPPEALLGRDAVAALSAVPPDVAARTVDDLDRGYADMLTEVTPELPPGPQDLDEGDLAEMPYPPEFLGLAPRAGEDLGETVRRWLSAIPPQWRLDALEAVVATLDPDDTE